MRETETIALALLGVILVWGLVALLRGLRSDIPAILDALVRLLWRK